MSLQRPGLVPRAVARSVSIGAAFVALCGAPSIARAQVFQLQGGGSSLFEGYGGVVNVWGNGFDGSLGIGYLDGLRIGATARRLLGGRDTLRLGNDVLPLTLPTDLLGGGNALMAQGISLQRRRGRTALHAFAGASANALAAPFFAANRANHAMGYVRATHDVSRTLTLSAHAVATSRQSLLAAATWRPRFGVTASAAGGVGANAPYAAVALDTRSTRLDLKAAFAAMGSRFRRAEAPMPLQSETERENVLVTWRPLNGVSFTAGRQHFRQDSAFRTLAPRAELTQVGVTATPWGTSLSSGWFLSRAGGQRNLSSYFSARTPSNRWGQAELYLLRVWEPEPARITTPVLLLRENVNSRFSLLQVITRAQGRTSVSFGGTVNSGLSSLSLDYQVVHSPYLTTNPFVQTIGVNARAQVGSYAITFGSFVTPDGKVHYSAQGSTFLYRGITSSAAPSGDAGGRFDRYLVNGEVVDEAGQAVQGAAIEIGGEMVYSDSRGRFFIRRSTNRAVDVRVVPDDFLSDARYEVVAAPARVTPVRDERVRGIVIVVRRVTPASQR